MREQGREAKVARLFFSVFHLCVSAEISGQILVAATLHSPAARIKQAKMGLQPGSGDFISLVTSPFDPELDRR
jgi:hypothetical protein